jgi:hypothetical protein
MDTRRYHTLPSDLLGACVRYGKTLRAHYASGGSPQSRAFSSHGAENNPILLGESKMAECIFCMEAGLNPREALKWSVDHPDGDYDCLLRQVRVDVKYTGINSRYLIWPINKNPIFDSKGFDALVLIKLDGDRGRGFVQGWMTKASFRKLRSIAGPGHKLDAGTRYVDQDLLLDMAKFPTPVCIKCHGQGFTRGFEIDREAGVFEPTETITPCEVCKGNVR